MTFEDVIVEQRPHIEELIHRLARHHFLSAMEVQEFRALVMEVLERNDFEKLRAFDGRTTWERYMTMVVSREFYCFQNLLWGQWRPSPEALSLGPAAVLLEELVVRDGMPLRDAVERMRKTHRVDVPRYRLVAFVEALGLDREPSTTSVQAREADRVDAHRDAALRNALALLSPDERLIVELRFRDLQPLTRIARIMNMDVRPLQCRLDAIKELVGSSLLAQGVTADEVEALLAQGERSPAEAPSRWWHSAFSRPNSESA